MRALLVAILFVVALPVSGADDGDDAALSLADQATIAPEAARPWRVFTEAAWVDSIARVAGTSQRGARLSLDMHLDYALTRDVRVVVADRLDARWQDDFADQSNINTLKEAYASWTIASGWISDLGRVNLRDGVATGYNPTDYFRAGAVRSVVSVDPASLRANRLGSVMLRNQFLWADGSFTALYSPRLADEPSNRAFSPDFGATNRDDRWLLAASHRVSERFSAQALTYGAAGRSPQVGLNLTTLIGTATVGYFEYSGGRSRSLAADALGLPDDTAFRNRLATGLTFTTADKLSLTAEVQANGAGLDRSGWEALQRQPLAYTQYRSFATSVQDPPTKRRIFSRVHWQDAVVHHLDLSANVFYNTYDKSRQPWVEARYHWSRVDLVVQRLWNSGTTGSEYGALPARAAWQVLVAVYF